jgi:hypothetical protein
MWLKVLLLSALMVATPAFAQDRAAGEAAGTPVALCELISANSNNAPSARLVSVTAIAYFDFEYGYFLADRECTERDGTGLLRIDLPSPTGAEAFSELQKLSSQEFLAANSGKTAYCFCTGVIDYRDGYPRFVLSSARVWAAN